VLSNLRQDAAGIAGREQLLRGERLRLPRPELRGSLGQLPCERRAGGAGASGQVSRTRIIVARTRVPATLEMTICAGVGNFANCAANPEISSSRTWPDSSRFNRASPLE
jgi:hypothetical protein